MQLMQRAKPVELDQDYDRRLLEALPSALNLFPSAALAAQFAEMAKQKRALCFTVIIPTSDFNAAGHRPASGAGAATAAVLVCFHVAPILAERGPTSLLKAIEEAAQHSLAPLHQVSVPVGRNHDGSGGFYREAVYEGDDDVYIAVVTHSPAEIPPESAEIVAQATRGTPVDIVTTVAVTPERPGPVAKAYLERRTARPTLH